ncbi:MAG: S8 family serine peptidase [Elusimicrobiota bacterium]
MKRTLSAMLSLSLLAFGPGIPAYAQMVAGTALRTAPSAPIVPVAPLGSLSGSALSGSALSGTNLIGPSLGLSLPQAPALQALPTVRALNAAARVEALPAISANAAAAPAPPANLSAAGAVREVNVLRTAFQTADGKETPFTQTMRALSEKTPEYKDMSAGASKETAQQDFSARIGETPSAVAAAVADPSAPVELIVSAADGSGRQLTQDVYPANLSQGVSRRSIDTALQKQLGLFGITRSLLSVHGAEALGTVAQINTAVIRVPGKDAASLTSAMKALGLQVQVGRVFARPAPQQAEPSARTVGLKEMGSIIGADKLQAELKKVLGEPAAPAPEKSRKPSLFARAAAWVKKNVLGVAPENPVLPWAILDSWSFVDHPFLKGRFLKSVANDDDGEAHGTHTAGTVVGVDIFNFHGRNYNIFPNGRASEGDILFKVNMAQKDGAMATTNSWGDGSGNPEGAIEKLFVKTAAEGMHHSISAGNSGSSRNTIGGPAIAYHNVDLVINGKVIGRVKRIKAIAASDANKKTAYFSSRGPGSRVTSRGDQYKDYPQKPDESGVGVNLVAPVPSGKTVEELGGPGAAMSGTSMSNPGVFGSFLLLTRGILVLLKDTLPNLPGPELTQFAMDLARHAMTQTAEKVAPVNEVGDGFVNVWAAFEYSAKLLKDNAPLPALARLHGLVRFFLGIA